MRPEIEVVGDKTVIAELVRTGDRAVDLMGFWPTGLEMLAQFAQEQYDTDGAFGAERWPELADTTRLRKQRDGSDNGILRETMETMFKVTNAGPLGESSAMTSDSLFVDGVTEQFTIQETNKGEGDMPRRHVFDFTQATANEFGDAMMAYVMAEYGPARRIYRDAAGRFARAPISND